MKRPIITAEVAQNLLIHITITEGKAPLLQLPARAVLTPSAMDMIRGRGIIVEYAPDEVQTSAHAVVQKDRTLAPETVHGSDENTFVAVRLAVLDKLPPDLRSSPLVDGLIRKVMQQGSNALGHVTLGASLSCETQKCENQAQWRSQAGGIVHIHSQQLPWQNFSGAGQKNAVNIVDVIGSTENAPWGVGYLEWDTAGFDWTLDYAEVDVVLEGELHITTQGKTLKVQAGDVVFVPKGTALRFESPGYVKFVYVTWPADWKGA